MSSSSRSSDGLDPRRKRLLFRCWHRGTKEMDVLLGRFADAHVADLSDSEIDELEGLIDLPDPDLYDAFNDKLTLPEPFHHGIFQRIKTFALTSSPE